MWDLPGPGFLTTGPLGSPVYTFFILHFAFCTTVAELSSCDRGSSTKPKIFTLWPFIEGVCWSPFLKEVLKLQCTTEAPGGLVKTDCQAPSLEVLIQ